MIKKIAQSLFDQLTAQAEEAKFQGLSEIENTIKNHCLADSQVISDDAKNKQLYSAYAYQDEIMHNLWDSFMKAAMFHNKNFDAIEANEVLNKCAVVLKEEFRKTLGANYIGSFEPKLPGQLSYKTAIEVED